MVSFLVVAAPHLIPCPVDPRTLADSADPTGENRKRRRRKVLDDDSSTDSMSEELRRRKQLEDKLSPQRECPVPKPGGLIGQVLGLKNEEQEVEPVSITKRIERAMCKPWSKNDDR